MEIIPALFRQLSSAYAGKWNETDYNGFIPT